MVVCLFCFSGGFWLHALGHCSVHSGVIFMLDSNGFLSITTVRVSFLPCVLWPFWNGLRFFPVYHGLIQMSRKKHSESVHGPWKGFQMILFTPARNPARSTKSWSGYDYGPATFRNPFVTSIFGRFCNNYLVELVMTPLRP